MAKFELLINQEVLVTHKVICETDWDGCELDEVLVEIDDKYDSIDDYIEEMATRGLKITSFEEGYQEYPDFLITEAINDI